MDALPADGALIRQTSEDVLFSWAKQADSLEFLCIAGVGYLASHERKPRATPAFFFFMRPEAVSITIRVEFS